jgi:hypothetical protein
MLLIANDGFSKTGNIPGLAVRRFDVYGGNIYRSNYKLLPVLEEGTHTIIIRPDATPFDKLAIYKSKPTQIKDSTYFRSYNTYIGKILLIGEVIH